MQPMIHVTPAAVQQAHVIRDATPEYKDLDLRIYLEGKNCDGFSYGVAFDTPREGDVTFSYENLTVRVDKESVVFLQNSIVEWVDDERGKGFDVRNPNQQKFRGKFFKRKSWQQYLEGQQEPS